MTAKTWLRFQEAEVRDGRRTRVWGVRRIDSGASLGLVEWRSGWRQYVFVPGPDTLYSAGCLEEIRAFVERETREHRYRRGLQRDAERVARKHGACTCGPEVRALAAGHASSCPRHWNA